MSQRIPAQPVPQQPRPRVNAGRLWAGGAAAALVAALVAIAGVLLSRGVFGIPILAREEDGAWGDATTWWYAGAAALAALAATAVVHALILTTPEPQKFFGWIVGVATVIAVLLPFTTGAGLDAKIATAVLNLVLGAAIGSLVTAVGRGASRWENPSAARPPGAYPPAGPA
ncbi:hypothetical protein GCM10028784_18710 [Myceligenerans cantabricum]